MIHRLLDSKIKKKVRKLAYGYNYRQFPVLQEDFFIYSMRNFIHIIEWFIVNVLRNPTGILEIGIERGLSTVSILGLCKKLKLPYIGIDPGVVENIKGAASKDSSIVVFENKSLEILPNLGRELKSKGFEFPNVVVIDGDHNYYTLYHELKILIFELEELKVPYLIFLHDVTWPNAFRDSYYNPADIPEEYRHDHDSNLWARYSHKELQDFGSITPKGQYHYAKTEGGPKNGTVPAVLDAIRGYKNAKLEFIIVPAVFGLGILLPLSSLSLKGKLKLLRFLEIFDIFFPLLWTLERNRLHLLEAYFKLEEQIKDKE